MRNKFLISICITSYKRVKELERCIKSIDSKFIDKVEIIVSEDNSPMKEEIRLLVDNIAKTSPYHIVFNSNVENLGYDRNLKKLITLSSGEYIFYLSDDDCLFPNSLDKIIDFIENSDKKPSLIFEPFYLPSSDEIRRKYDRSHEILPGEDSAVKYYHAAILFSGLIFKKSLVKDLDAEKFKNINYFQVYMFLYVMYKYGGYYLDVLTVNSVSDGENAYGQVFSSGENALLANRNSVLSDLEFNKGLVKVFEFFDQDFNTNIYPSFVRMYSVRTFGGLSLAKTMGRKTFKEYWVKLNTVIKPNHITYTYYVLISILGGKLSRKLFHLAKRIKLKQEAHVG